jgi:hypothetical protein
MGLEAAKRPMDFKKLRLFMGVQFLGNQSSGQLNQLLATSKVISDLDHYFFHFFSNCRNWKWEI